jgi:DNA repair protein RadC
MVEVGPAGLATRELLAILVDGHPGGDRALRAASALVAGFSRPDAELRLRAMAGAGVAEVARTAGVGAGAAARVLAAFELGRRAAEEDRPARGRIRGPADVHARMRLRMRDLPQEELVALLLDARSQVLREVVVTRGTVDTALLHPREIFRPAIQEAAHTVVLVHNHPCGDPSPSDDDLAATAQAASAGLTIGIPVADHVIVGEDGYFSFLETGLLRLAEEGGRPWAAGP